MTNVYFMKKGEVGKYIMTGTNIPIPNKNDGVYINNVMYKVGLVGYKYKQGYESIKCDVLVQLVEVNE